MFLSVRLWLLQSACQMFLGKMRNSKQLSNASIRICMSVNVGQEALEWVKEGCCINHSGGVGKRYIRISPFPFVLFLCNSFSSLWSFWHHLCAFGLLLLSLCISLRFCSFGCFVSLRWLCVCGCLVFIVFGVCLGGGGGL